MTSFWMSIQLPDGFAVVEEKVIKLGKMKFVDG